jgi:GntR family transcriptional regulator
VLVRTVVGRTKTPLGARIGAAVGRQRLAAEGLIELRHGDGTYVCPPKTQADAQLALQREKFQKEFDALIHQGVMLGYSAADFRARLTLAMATARKQQQ